MLCSKENSDERPLSRTTLDLLKQTLGMQRKPRKCFVWNFNVDPWRIFGANSLRLYACLGMCWLPLRPETAVKESEAAQLGPLKKIFQWFRHDAPNQAWRTDVPDGCLTRFCKILWFRERERERERERKCSNLANAWCLNCCLQHNENWRKVLCKKCLPQSRMNTLMIHDYCALLFLGGFPDQGEKEAGVKSCELPVKDWRMNSMFDRLIKFDNVWCLNNIPSFSLLSIQLQHLRTTWCHRVDVQTSIGGRVWAWERRHSGEALDALTLTLCWWHRVAEIEVVKR